MASLCDADFISAYDKIACTNKNEISLCMERMRTLPTSEWQTYLIRIQENKLHLGTGTYRATETAKKKNVLSIAGCTFTTPQRKSALMDGAYPQWTT